MKKIGLTGNIASGKSQVEHILNDLKYCVLDLDIVSHNLLDSDIDLQNEILKEFGSLNRKDIGKIVFSNDKKREKLDEIYRPRIKEKILEFFSGNTNKDIVFVSGALIFEAGFDKLFDKIIYVDADIKKRIKRIIKRNNLSYKEALLRVKSQNLKYKDSADFIVENNSTIDELKNKIKNILNVL